MHTDRIEELTQQVATDDEALTLTMFCRKDLTDMAEQALSNHCPDFAHAVLPAVVDAVQADYEWAKLDEILSERGNATLTEAVHQIERDLHATDGEHTVFDARLLVERGETLTPAVAISGFTSAREAHEWAASMRGRPASDAPKRRLGEHVELLAQPDPDVPRLQPIFAAVTRLELVVRDARTGNEQFTLTVALE